MGVFRTVCVVFNYQEDTFLSGVSRVFNNLIHPFGNNHFKHLKFTDMTRLVSLFGGTVNMGTMMNTESKKNSNPG